MLHCARTRAIGEKAEGGEEIGRRRERERGEREGGVPGWAGSWERGHVKLCSGRRCAVARLRSGWRSVKPRALGSGPWYQILSHVFHVVRIKKNTDMRESHAFRTARDSCETRAILACPYVFWLAKRAKKCDTNHIPRETAYRALNTSHGRGAGRPKPTEAARSLSFYEETSRWPSG